MINHTPKIFDGGLKRALSRYKELIVAGDGRVDVVGIYIRITYVLVALNQANSSMFDYSVKERS